VSVASSPSPIDVAADRIALRRIDLASDDDATRADVRALVRRSALPGRTVRDGARTIVEEVARRGSEAVRAANARFGGGLADGRLLVARDELVAAADALPAGIREAIVACAARVEAFARPHRPASSTVTSTAPGVEIERRWTAVDRVGCYVPGGSAPLPSSLVMTVVPARVAGVAEVVVATPARADGTLDPVVAGVAGLLGIDLLLAAGGAQAIAGLAFGLDDAGLQPVDLVVGPGNAWVTAAKLEVSSVVAIDLPAGPSEGLVLADGAADPATVAADLLTQAEHGPDSPAILVTTSATLADGVEREVSARLGRLSRAAVLRRSLAERGAIVLAHDLDAAVRFVNAYAPEHLSVDVAPVELEATVDAIRRAGSVFVGRWAPESAGDYATGANHVLPTGGLARGRGPLGVEAFGAYSQVQRIDRAGLAALRPTIEALAAAEGLDAHADAVAARFPVGAS
jgi:histidinol dehydrogenase